MRYSVGTKRSYTRNICATSRANGLLVAIPVFCGIPRVMCGGFWIDMDNRNRVFRGCAMNYSRLRWFTRSGSVEIRFSIVHHAICDEILKRLGTLHRVDSAHFCIAYDTYMYAIFQNDFLKSGLKFVYNLSCCMCCSFLKVFIDSWKFKIAMEYNI